MVKLPQFIFCAAIFPNLSQGVGAVVSFDLDVLLMDNIKEQAFLHLIDLQTKMRSIIRSFIKPCLKVKHNYFLWNWWTNFHHLLIVVAVNTPTP